MKFITFSHQLFFLYSTCVYVATPSRKLEVIMSYCLVIPPANTHTHIQIIKSACFQDSSLKSALSPGLTATVLVLVLSISRSVHCNRADYSVPVSNLFLFSYYLLEVCLKTQMAK